MTAADKTPDEHIGRQSTNQITLRQCTVSISRTHSSPSHTAPFPSCEIVPSFLTFCIQPTSFNCVVSFFMKHSNMCVERWNTVFQSMSPNITHVANATPNPIWVNVDCDKEKVDWKIRSINRLAGHASLSVESEYYGCTSLNEQNDICTNTNDCLWKHVYKL